MFTISLLLLFLSLYIHASTPEEITASRWTTFQCEEGQSVCGGLQSCSFSCGPITNLTSTLRPSNIALTLPTGWKWYDHQITTKCNSTEWVPVPCYEPSFPCQSGPFTQALGPLPKDWSYCVMQVDALDYSCKLDPFSSFKPIAKYAIPCETNVTRIPLARCSLDALPKVNSTVGWMTNSVMNLHQTFYTPSCSQSRVNTFSTNCTSDGFCTSQESFYNEIKAITYNCTGIEKHLEDPWGFSRNYHCSFLQKDMPVVEAASDAPIIQTTFAFLLGSIISTLCIL